MATNIDDNIDSFDMDKKMIKIVWSIFKKSERVLIQLHSSIVSVLENTKEALEIHILCDENLTSKDRTELKEFIEKKYGQVIYFHDIQFDFSKVNFPMSHTKGTYYRLFISDYIGQSGKLIYLDYDVYVNLDINELWETELEDRSIGVVIDGIALMKNPSNKIINYFSTRNIDIRQYFNAGVMLINLEKWNSAEIVKQAKLFYEKHPYCRFVDQDFLNNYFRGKVKFLPEKFNIMDIYSHNTEEITEMNGIFHFCGLPKPWDVYRGDIDKLFWINLAKTKYGYYGKDMINCIPKMNWRIDECIEKGMPLGGVKQIIKALIKRGFEKIRRKYSNNPFDVR